MIIKKILLSALLLSTGVSLSQTSTIPGMSGPLLNAILANRPDLDSDGNNIVDMAEANGLTGNLVVTSSSVNNINALKHFIGLSGLICSVPQVAHISFNTNMALENVMILSNDLASCNLGGASQLKELRLYMGSAGTGTLDLSQNPLLEILISTASYGTGFTQLHLNNPLLTELIFDHELTSVNLSSLVSLKTLKLDHNALSTLDVSANQNLEVLGCEGNNLLAIHGLHQTSQLEWIDCSYNVLTSLDFRQKPNLSFINCSSNQLTCLNVNTGYNPNLMIVNSFGNSLSCIEVQDPAISSSALQGWVESPGVTYSTNCNNGCFPSGPIRYVTISGGIVTRDGLSWATAYNQLEIQQAIDDISTVGYGDVWVAEGTYYPTNTNDRDVSINLKNNVKLYGGFSGIETALSQRDLSNHETVLSGDIGLANINSDNSHHILKGVSENKIYLDGFTIRDGNAYGSSPQFGLDGGAGIFSYNCHLTVKNCAIKYNLGFTGAGVIKSRRTLNMERCVVSYNKSGNTGGGVFALSGTSTNLNNCEFRRNYALYEGDDASVWEHLVVTNSLFDNPNQDGLYIVYNGTVDIRTSSIHTTVTNYFGGSKIHNSILSIQKPWGSTFTFYNCLVKGSGGSASWNSSYGSDGGNNIGGTPQYVDAANGDFRLSAGSPCIDKGNNIYNLLTEDLAGNVRVQNGVIDMGAYEGGITVVNNNHSSGNKTGKGGKGNKDTMADKPTVMVYPNPSASGQVSVQPRGFENQAIVVVTNASGKVILEEAYRGATLNLDLSNYDAGLYFVRVLDASNQAVEIGTS